MHKSMFAAVIAAGLIAAPFSPLRATAAAQTAQPAAPAATTTAKPKKPESPGLAAFHERQKKCGAEWKAAKANGKVEKGMSWPKYLSACNKRLKSGG